MTRFSPCAAAPGRPEQMWTRVEQHTFYTRISGLDPHCARAGDDTLSAMRSRARPAGKKTDTSRKHKQFTLRCRVWIHCVRELEMTRFSLCAAAPGQPHKTWTLVEQLTIHTRISRLDPHCARAGDDTLFALLGRVRPRRKKTRTRVENYTHVTHVSRVCNQSVREMEMKLFSLSAVAPGRPGKCKRELKNEQ